MKKRPFLLFILVLSAWVAAAIVFIQSPRFAKIFKKVVARYVPGDLGVDADFSEFAIQLFPPGVSLKNPKISLRERNVLKMPAGTTVQAERINLNFQLFQALSGDIRIHEAVIVNGDATVVLDSGKDSLKQKVQNRPAKLNFHWDELLQVRAEAVALENTKLHLVWKHPDFKKADSSIEFLAKSFRLSQWSGKGGMGYETSIDLNQVRLSNFDEFLQGVHLPGALNRVRALIRVNRAGALLEEFFMDAHGVEARSKGKVQGDVLNGKTSKSFDLEYQVNGDLKSLGTFFAHFSKNKNTSIPALEGQGKFLGQVRGGFDSQFHSVKADGQLEIQNLQIQQWRADRLLLEGSWHGSDTGGEWTISKGLITSREIERSLGNKSKAGGIPGSGGEIGIGSFKLNSASLTSRTNPLSIPLTLKRAHIHWLVGSEVRSIYPLIFRATGPVQLTWVPGSQKLPWKIQMKSSLAVSDFELDNQKMGAIRPLHRVLKLPKFSLQGTTIIDSTGVKPQDMVLRMDQTQFNVNGRVDFNQGFDLHAKGQVNFQEIHEIAESPIQGEGPLAIHVHGPFSQVILDFDADLENSSYLNMNFGSLKGRMTWDDHLNQLVLNGLKAKKNQTVYSANGLVDLGDRESVNIRVKVLGGNIKDLNDVFTNMTRDFWWFPHSLAGAVDGEVAITGGVSMKELEVKANLSGRNWDVLGERIDGVTLIGGYDKGLYYLRDVHATKHGGKLMGHISYRDSDKKFDWEFQTQQLGLTDFDHLAQLDVPIRGKVVIKSLGKGRQDALESESQVLISDLFVKGAPLPSSRLWVKTADGKLELKGNALDGQGTLDFSYNFLAGKESYLRAELNHLDFSPILLLLNPQALPDSAVASYGSGLVNLSFRSGEIDRANGEIEVNEFSLARTGSSFHLVRPLSFKISDGSFDLKGISFAGNRGEALFRLQSRNAQLEGTLSGSLDVSIVEFLTSSVTQATGVALLDFAIGGNLKAPTLSGRATLDGISFRVPSVESPFENVTGVLQLKQNQVMVRDFQADLAGGRVRAGGEVTVFADRYPQLSLQGSLSGTKIKVPPFQYAKVNGDLKVYGDRLPYSVDGSIGVESALLKENMLQQKATTSLNVVRFTPPPSLRRMADYPKFKLNIHVKSEGGIFVQNDLFDAELKAQIQVINTIEVPRILGSVDVIHGYMIFKDRKFQIQSAAAVFDNPTLFNPRFNLSATTDMSWVKVQLYAAGRVGGEGGRVSKEPWKIELSSNPSMPESEIISLLALGMTASETKKLNSSDRAVLDQGGAASLLLHSLDFNREVENKTGFQVHLDESVNSQQGMSVSRPQTAGNESGAAPKIVIKKQVTKNIDVSYGSTVGVGASSQRQVNAEVKVTPGFSVIGVWDTYQGSEATDRRTSYGMDLKLQKRFK